MNRREVRENLHESCLFCCYEKEARSISVETEGYTEWKNTLPLHAEAEVWD